MFNYSQSVSGENLWIHNIDFGLDHIRNNPFEELRAMIHGEEIKDHHNIRMIDTQDFLTITKI